MTAVILDWDPSRWNWEGRYTEVVERIVETGVYRQRWHIDRVGNLAVDTDVWLLVQGIKPQMRGLIGHGITASGPYEASHDDPQKAGAVSMYVDVDFDKLLPHGDQVPVGLLIERVPGAGWYASGSGRDLPGEHEADVRALWSGHLPKYTDSLDPPPGLLPADALTRVFVNRFERNPEARRIAIAHHGSSCHACGMDFETKYGPVGRGLVHVHHTVPVSQLGPRYEIDPITDLVPLCPNCHYMAHLRRPDSYTVTQLRAMMVAAGFIAGTVLTNEQLEAEAAAQRLRNG